MKENLHKFFVTSVAVLIVVLFSTSCKKCETSPLPTTLPATFAIQSGVTLNGRINAYGKVTSVTFEFGETSSYGQTVYLSQKVFGVAPLEVYTDLSGLSSGTTYHYRVKAIGPCQTINGTDISFNTLKSGESGIIFDPDLSYGSVSDNEGNSYKTIQIATQTWMAENLKTTKLNDGTSIELVSDGVQWINSKLPAFCWYNNDSKRYKASIGALYNWSAVNTGKLCPTGWHVPNDSEWSVLINHFGGEEPALGRLQETGTTHWLNYNPLSTNVSGFTALPGGYRTSNLESAGGVYTCVNFFACWWSSAESSVTDSWKLDIYFRGAIGELKKTIIDKRDGNSVRCLKD